LRLRNHFVVLVAATLLPVLVLAVTVVLLVQRERHASMQRGLQGTARALAAAVDRELDSSVTALETLGDSPALDEGNLPAFYEHARRARDDNPRWLTVFLVEASGRQVMTLLRPLGAPLPDAGDVDYVRAVLDTRRPYVSDLALGGRVLDSSPMYGAAESVAGDLATELALVDRLFVATKVWTSGREAGIAQMERSLARLRRRRLDLMQIHNLLDWRTHLRTLRDWQQAGRVRYVGVTHYTASAYDELERVLRAEPLDFVQVNYSLGEREAERRILPLARDRGIAVLVNRPFSEGGLFQRVRGQALPAWTAAFGCQRWSQTFLQWILAHPAVTCVIPATSRLEHLVDNMTAGVG